MRNAPELAYRGSEPVVPGGIVILPTSGEGSELRYPTSGDTTPYPEAPEDLGILRLEGGRRMLAEK